MSMNQKSKAKEKRALSPQANFVTDLTPEQCRAIFERATIYERVTVQWHDELRFNLERQLPIALGIAIPVNFDGTLTETSTGTRVQGRVTPETLPRIGQALRINRSAWMGVAALGPLVALMLGDAAPDWTVFVIVYVVAMAFLAFVSHQKIAFLPVAMISWLDDRLHPPPDLMPDVPSDADQHDRAHTV